MEVYPQELINVAVADAASAKTLAASAAVGRAVSEAEERLGEEGRILLRPSGTEPVVRVMVEHADEDVCREVLRVGGWLERRRSGREVRGLRARVEAGRDARSRFVPGGVGRAREQSPTPSRTRRR